MVSPPSPLLALSRHEQGSTLLVSPRAYIAEIGAHYVKSYYFEPGFEKVVAGCPVPIVIAGEKTTGVRSIGYGLRAIDQGAAGVDMNRFVFHPTAPLV